MVFLTYLAARNNPAAVSVALPNFLQDLLSVLVASAVAIVAQRQLTPNLGMPLVRLQYLAVLAAPALVALAVTEQGHMNRLWWLWPVELILIFIPLVSPLSEGRLGAHAVSLAIVLVLAFNSTAISRVKDAMKHGFRGSRNPIAALLDRVGDMNTKGTPVSVGYAISVARWVPVYSAVNPIYKAGMEEDLYLDYKYGLSNASHCAEGLSPSDNFRIVDSAIGIHGYPGEIETVASMAGYQTVECIDGFCLYQRTP
jgi:hypothetical protein